MFWKKRNKVNINDKCVNKEKPKEVRICHDRTQLSGEMIQVTEQKCDNCGGTFTLWHLQRNCTYCGTEYTPSSLSWFCH